MKHTRIGLFLACAWLASLPACTSDAGRGEGGVVYTEPREPCADFNPARNLYFGDLHAHSVLSHDAWIFETRSTPEEAYAFARGAPVQLAPIDASGKGTRTLSIDRSIDFAALTEHSEYLGETEVCTTPGSNGYDSPTCVVFRKRSFLSTVAISNQLSFPDPRRSKDICGASRTDCLEQTRSVWRRLREAADGAYDRTSACSFTTLLGYEYTATTGAVNLHRNVLFRNGHVPDLPVSYFEAPAPEKLWSGLESACTQGVAGCEALVIPHNSDESNGNKFFPRYPPGASLDEQREAARKRAGREPLVEIFQQKGDSECMNGLAGVPGERDDLCDFEKLPFPPFDDCGDATGIGGVMGLGCVSRLDYVRNVLLLGLQEEERLGVNPYKLGVLASTDTHNASPGAVAEDRYAGHLGNEEDTPEKRLGPAAGGGGHEKVRTNPGGLTAVWAVENSRDAIFEALKRREVYATSGPRIGVRLFAGWELPERMCDGEATFARLGYEQGVPMGGDLTPRSSGTGSPGFAVMAWADPGPGAVPLQRIQIIKGWIGRDGNPMLTVYEVAGDPANGAEVDLETCEPRGAGFDRLCTVWSDPEFDPSERAFYYARIVQNPTCRWSQYDCHSLPAEDRPAACDDPNVEKVVQERAWTSPIWYRPD